ncbi:hypothetical protein C2S53_019311 [Perilla frutescens var. hirtella]|uniref:Apple domain-containing protein n=1 Tax=Perilla frutescens var. hirtella TaxID=608512 RepID=A0AAD4NYN0_PERFH|nr:hypothetical protein C2S53_019311 [Perilla frutescens var. hirtella]
MNGDKKQRYQLVLLVCATVVLNCAAQGNSTPTNPCGTCGAFGVCNSQDSSAAVCSCLQGFDPVDDEEWSRGNWSSGCRRRLPLNCSTQPDKTTDDVFVVLPMMEMSGYADLYTGLQQNECRGRCLSNCSCLAYGFVDSFGCMFWTAGTLMDLRKSPTGLGSDLYVRLSKSEPDKYDSRLTRKKDSSMKKKIVIIMALVAFIIVTSACTYISWKWRAKKKKIKLVDEVWNMWKEDNVEGVIDSRISSSSYSEEAICFHCVVNADEQ